MEANKVLFLKELCLVTAFFSHHLTIKLFFSSQNYVVAVVVPDIDQLNHWCKHLSSEFKNFRLFKAKPLNINRFVIFRQRKVNLPDNGGGRAESGNNSLFSGGTVFV